MDNLTGFPELTVGPPACAEPGCGARVLLRVTAVDPSLWMQPAMWLCREHWWQAPLRLCGLRLRAAQLAVRAEAN